MNNDTIKIEDAGEIKNFETVRQCVYVGVYFFEYSSTPYAYTHQDKNELIKLLNGMGNLDKSKPVRLYTIVL
jgi:hypothetical protein